MANPSASSKKWDKRQIGMAFLAAGLFGVMILILLRQMNGPQTQNERVSLWYYDLSANKLVRAPDRLPPIEENGQVLVRAYVYSCGECSDAGKRYIGYLERFSPELLKFRRQLKSDYYQGPGGMNEVDENALKSMTNGTVEISEKGTEWIDTFTKEASAIKKHAIKPCPDNSTPRRCDSE